MRRAQYICLLKTASNRRCKPATHFAYRSRRDAKMRPSLSTTHSAFVPLSPARGTCAPSLAPHRWHPSLQPDLRRHRRHPPPPPLLPAPAPGSRRLPPDPRLLRAARSGHRYTQHHAAATGTAVAGSEARKAREREAGELREVETMLVVRGIGPRPPKGRIWRRRGASLFQSWRRWHCRTQ